MRADERGNAARSASKLLPDLENNVGADEALEIRLLLRLLSCASLAEREIRENLHTSFGATIARFEVLAQLYRVEGGLGMKQLADRLMVTKGNVTGLINRMTDAGLIDRRRDSSDGRAQMVVLTAKGRRLFKSMQPLHNHWVREMMSGLGSREKRLLYEFLGGLKACLEARRRPLPRAGASGRQRQG